MKIAESRRIELIFLLELYKRRNGGEVWQIVNRLGVSLSDAAVAFRNLTERGLVSKAADTVCLTSLGRSWVVSNQNEFAFSGEKSWRKVPEIFEVDMIPPFQPYVPRLSRLDRNFFET